MISMSQNFNLYEIEFFNLTVIRILNLSLIKMLLNLILSVIYLI